ncbi:hypothetical protein D623_10007151 [Myotis brandtii]|uniref:Uncharacterized protein n=1 Tax=Myotis brandtii TaxID=109478 RepID=S7N6J7_MYOBR|nr:hypothetical protein D623_10007151 [Myotis brandtii]
MESYVPMAPHHRGNKTTLNAPMPAARGGLSEVEIISQQGDEETKSVAAGQLASFAYRDLPLAPVDLSAAGSQLLSNLDEDYQREGPCRLASASSTRGKASPAAISLVV